jgi:hypothetical protein
MVDRCQADRLSYPDIQHKLEKNWIRFKPLLNLGYNLPKAILEAVEMPLIN